MNEIIHYCCLQESEEFFKDDVDKFHSNQEKVCLGYLFCVLVYTSEYA